MKTSLPRPSAGRVAELDGLRGVLALWVAVAHVLLWCGFAEAPFGGRAGRFFITLVYSPEAVEVFFILSGFAISYLIYSQKQGFGSFMTGRFFRIYPVYLLCLALGVGAAWLTGFILDHASWRETSYFDGLRMLADNEQARPTAHLAAHLGLAHGVFPQTVLPGGAATLLVPAWSISVEWQYYTCALLIAFCSRHALGLLLLAGGCWFAARHGAAWINPLPAFLPLVLPFFLIGIGSYHLYVAHFAKGGGRSRRNARYVAVALAGAILLQWHSLSLAIWIVAFGSLFVEPSRGFGRILVVARRILGHPVTQFLGKISYPLYLVHWPLLILLLTILLHYRPNASAFEAAGWMTLVGIPLMLAAGYLLHRTIEAPFMQLGRRLTRPAARTDRDTPVAITPAISPP